MSSRVVSALTALTISSALLTSASSQTFSTDPATLTIGRTGLTATTLPDGTVLAAGGSDNNGQAYSSIDRILSTSSVGTGAAMYSARQYATATLLSNGTVLVTGGWNGSAPVNDSETYDPRTHYFTTTGNMVRERYGHTATLLKDGRVLIVGGRDPGGSEIDQMEIYDPNTRNYTAVTPRLTYARYFHTATLLPDPDGRVFIAGGEDYHSTGIVQSEIFDPVSQLIVPAGNLVQGRAYHTANLLPNGKVLLAGGKNSSGTYAVTELYDPSANSSTASGSLSTARFAHTATSLADGRILFAGGYTSGTNATASAELFDPTTGTFSATGSLASARAFHSAVNMQDGTVLVLGGANGSSSLSSLESYSFVQDAGNIRPKFVVVSVAYAPPGAGSNVNYSNTTTLGTNFTFSQSLSNGVSVSVDRGFKAPFLGEADIKDTSGWAKTVGSTSSYGLTKTLDASDVTPGPQAPGLDHNSDVYWVWLNPIFDITLSPNATTFMWNTIAYDPTDLNGMDVLPLQGTYAQNPGAQTAGIAARTGRGFDSSLGALNSTDYQTILNRNPFIRDANYNPNVVDPITGSYRFQSVQPDPINYIPAAPGSQPLTHTQTITYASTNGAGTTSKDDYSTSFTLSSKMGYFGPKVMASLTNTTQLSLSSSYNQSTSKGDKASLSVTGPKSTDNYQGTTAFGLYQDNIYGTFMFFPITPGRPAAYADLGSTPTNNPSAFQSAGGTATVSGEADRFQFGSRPATTHRNPGTCIWSGFGSGPSSSAETLYLNYSVSADFDDLNGGDGNWNYAASVDLSLDGGVSWSRIANPNSDGQTTASIPVGTDLSQVQVKASVSANVTTGSGTATASMPISLMVVQ